MRTAPPTPFRAVLASAWISRQRAGKRWLLPVLVAVLMLVLALAVTFEAPVDGRRFLDVGPVVLCAMLGLGVLALTFVAWASLLSDVLRQNHPCHARLVPGHRRQLRLALLRFGAIAAGLSIGPLLLCWWIVLSTPRTLHPVPILLSLVIGLAGLYALTAVLMRWSFLVWLLLVGAVAGWPSAKQIAGTVDALAGLYLRADTPPLGWAIAAAVCGLACLLVRAVVLGGGTCHRRLHVYVLMVAGLMPLRPRGGAHGARSGGDERRRRHRSTVRWPAADRVMARLFAGYRVGPGQGLPPVLQPRVYRRHEWLLLALRLAAAAALACTDPGSNLRRLWTDPLMLMLTVGVMVEAFTPVRRALLDCRREQALLLLLPGMPRGAALNRWLACQTATAALSGLVANGAVALTAMAWLGQVHSAWWTANLSGLLLGVCIIPCHWRDWARVDPATPRRPVLLQWLEQWPLLLVLALHLAVQFLAAPALPVLWLAELLVAAAWGLRQWRAMAGWPGAWPVGHAHREGRSGAACRVIGADPQ